MTLLWKPGSSGRNKCYLTVTTQGWDDVDSVNYIMSTFWLSGVIEVVGFHNRPKYVRQTNDGLESCVDAEAGINGENVSTVFITCFALYFLERHWT